MKKRIRPRWDRIIVTGIIFIFLLSVTYHSTTSHVSKVANASALPTYVLLEKWNGEEYAVPTKIVERANRLWALEESKIRHGGASYYGNAQEGRLTSMGKTFQQSGMTAATSDFSLLGKNVVVTCERNAKSVTVFVNDTGNFGKLPCYQGCCKRVICLSKAAYQRIAPSPPDTGTIHVRIEPL